MYTIIDKNNFVNGVSNAIRGVYTLVQNPTKSELQTGNYKPRLTLTNRFREETLAIELSLPKLMFGNNFDELTDNDFNSIIEMMRLKLKEMGVLVFSAVLSNSLVSSVHYSKNIPLTDGSTPSQYIKRISEANIKAFLDINHTDFRNGGHGFKWHCNSYEVTFYDKLKDLQMAKKSGKRAIESDNVVQLNLFDDIEKNKPFEVLRMEVRIGKRQKIRQIIKSVGIETEPTFKTLFSSGLSQKILLSYLHELESRRPPLQDYHSNKPKELLADLIVNNPSLGLKRTLQLFGLKQAMDVISMREIRQIFKSYSDRSWYRLVSEANQVRLPIAKDHFGIIRTYLANFTPLKLVDFQLVMLNNDKNK